MLVESEEVTEGLGVDDWAQKNKIPQTFEKQLTCVTIWFF
jgi:hypothetical protein